MILPELVKAVQRIDEKVNTLVDIMAPMANTIHQLKLGSQFDARFIQALASQSVRYKTDTLLEESKIKHLDGLSALAKKKGHKDQTTVSMDEVRQLLATMQRTPHPQLRHSDTRILTQEATKILERVHVEVKRVVEFEVKEVKGMVSRALRASDQASKKAMEAQRIVEEDVNKKINEVRDSIGDGIAQFVGDKIDEVNKSSVKAIDGLRADAKQKLEEMKKIKKDIDEAMATVEKRSTTVVDMVRDYKKSLRDAVKDAKQDMNAEADLIHKAVEKQIVKSGGEVQAFLSKSTSRVDGLLSDAQDKIDAFVAQANLEVEGKASQLQGKYEELKGLARRTEDAIIEVEKATASVGNSTPRNLRHKIRISNV